MTGFHAANGKELSYLQDGRSGSNPGVDVLQDEHADQLRGLAQLSALLASFGIIAFIQFGFDPTQLHLGLLITFAVANALTVSLLSGADG